MQATVADIAGWVGGTVVGDGAVLLTGVNGIRHAADGDLTFLYDPRYAPDLNTTKASAVLVGRNVNGCLKPLIQVDSPYAAMVMVLRRIELELRMPLAGVHPSAHVGEGVQLGEGVAIGPLAIVEDGSAIGANTLVMAGAYIGPHVRIGKDCVISPRAVLRDRVVIGDRCLIHSGAVLGTDGFGFLPHEGQHVKIPQVGTVILGDDVEIGANAAVDRGTMGNTTVGNGSKIDNLVQIGHNVQIGQNTIVCGNAGIAGSTVLGNNVTIAGGAGITGHIEIGDGAVVGANSGVTNSVKPGSVVFGYPAVEVTRSRRMYAALRNLPQDIRRIRDLENRLVELEKNLHGKTEDNR